MSDDFATRKDVNGLGAKVNGLCVDFARCSGRNEGLISELQRDTALQWEELNSVKEEIHNLAIGIQTMRDDMIGKISVRLGIVITVATALIIIAEFMGK